MSPAHALRGRLALILTLLAGLAIASPASADTIWAATADNRLMMFETAGSSSGWWPVGSRNAVRNVTAMTASDTTHNLWVTKSDNQLWVTEPHWYGVEWRFAGHANGVVALAAWTGHLYAVTSDGLFWSRPQVENNANWTLIGTAPLVTSMTGFDGRVWATTSNHRLLVTPARPTLSPNWKDVGHANHVVGLTTVGEAPSPLQPLSPDTSLVAAVTNGMLNYRSPVLWEQHWGVFNYHRGHWISAYTPAGIVDLASTWF
jgi:hypothetical protein